MTFLRTFWIICLLVTCIVTVATGFSEIHFIHANYWDHHGVLFLIAISLFPRLTLLLSSVSTGGLLWWLSWIFAPRLLVAVLATLAYFHQNPFLVTIAWVVALGGESSEKFAVFRQSRSSRWSWTTAYYGQQQDQVVNDQTRFKSAKWVDAK